MVIRNGIEEVSKDFGSTFERKCQLLLVVVEG
jgi:hypothetical protein